MDYKELFEKEKLKSDYYFSVIKVLESSYNIGEKDEFLISLKLLYLNLSKQYDELMTIFGDDASEGITIINMENNTIIYLFSDIKKASGSYKADISIKMNKTNEIYNASIKSKNGANPAILNHTPRCVKVFCEGGILNSKLHSIDKIINEYIEKRKSKKYGEDMLLINLECLVNTELKKVIYDILCYFIFEGTGKGDSKVKANSIIYYQNNNILFKKYISHEEKIKYIDSIINNCVISLRDKGMPKKINDICKPWIFEDIKENGEIKYKGSLHIRFK